MMLVMLRCLYHINRHIQPPVCTQQCLNYHHHSPIQLHTSIGSVPLHLHLPIGEESDFVGVIDLVADTAVIWRDEELGKDDDMMLVMMMYDDDDDGVEELCDDDHSDNDVIDVDDDHDDRCH